MTDAARPQTPWELAVADDGRAIVVWKAMSTGHDLHAQLYEPWLARTRRTHEHRRVAGIETSIEVPSLKLVLDMGRCSRTAVNCQTVVVSHGHLDHAGALTQHAARRNLYEVALLAFTGDTRIEGIEREPELRTAETLIIETSFF